MFISKKIYIHKQKTWKSMNFAYATDIYILYITNTRMCAIDTIKKAGLICDDVANYVLLDFMVGDKKTLEETV